MFFGMCDVHHWFRFEHCRIRRRPDGSFVFFRIPTMSPNVSACPYCDDDELEAISRGEDYCRPSPSADQAQAFVDMEIQDLCTAAFIVTREILGED